MKYAKHILLAIATILVSGCLHDDAHEVVSEKKSNILLKANIVLQKPENCSGFKQYLTKSLISQYIDNRNEGGGWCPNCRFFTDTGAIEAQPTAGAETDAPASSVQDGAAKNTDPGSVTGTNNQEIGVDELDRLKTDSKGNMYLVQDNQLIIIDAFPADEMSIASRLDVEFNPSGLFIDEANQKAIIISQRWVNYSYTVDVKTETGWSLPGEPMASEPVIKPMPSGSGTSEIAIAAPVYLSSKPEVIMYIVDISDIKTPTLLDTLHINGNFNSARMIDSRLHVIANHLLYNIEESFKTETFVKKLEDYWLAKDFVINSSETDTAQLYADLSEMISEGINTLDLDTVFPYLQLNDDEKAPLLSCTSVYHPNLNLKSASLTSVISLNSDGSDMSTSAVFSSGGIVYSSAKSIYVSQPSGGWWWANPQQQSTQQTAIHQFSIDKKNTQYSASGLIKGIPQKSFNFSEYNGSLRVATTETSWPNDSRGRVTTNHLFVLQDDQEGILAVTGSVEDFGKDESIMSARFLGDRGFVVTFRQTDPLFSFDLSNPTEPKLMGELKIPGFSTYMHPIDENHLLTIGRAGTENGATQETQLQIFDISDLTNPILVDAHIPELLRNNTGYSYSIAEADHHAFTFSAQNNMLAIPLSYYNWETNDSFAGIATFKIDLTNGITENGNVDHTSFINESDCGNKEVNIGNGVMMDTDCINHYYRWNIRPNRSVITSDDEGEFQLYSLSRFGVKANDLNDMSNELGNIMIKTTN